MKIGRMVPTLLLLVGWGTLGGCSNSLSLPWEKDMLDPGRVATREPLEIPPDLSEFPSSNARREDPALDTWVDPEKRLGNQGAGKKEGAKGSGDVKGSGDAKVPFDVPVVREGKEGLSRNEKENLPGWMETPIKTR